MGHPSYPSRSFGISIWCHNFAMPSPASSSSASHVTHGAGISEISTTLAGKPTTMNLKPEPNFRSIGIPHSPIIPPPCDDTNIRHTFGSATAPTLTGSPLKIFSAASTLPIPNTAEPQLRMRPRDHTYRWPRKACPNPHPLLLLR